MSRFFLKGLLAALVFIAASETLARWALPAWFGTGLVELEDFYLPERRIAEQGAITHLFVGSSQVAASIRPDTLQALLRAAAAPAERDRIRAINAGKGYSTQIQHYFGVQDLIERYPASLQGVTVFAEAPEGVADYRTWHGEWTSANWPSTLGPLIPTSEVPRFLVQADNTMPDKARATTAHFLHTGRYMRWVRFKLESTVNRRLIPPTPDGGEPVDLAPVGGIRTDEAGVELTKAESMRAADQRWMEMNAEGGREAEDWEHSIWADMLSLVRAQGGDLVFFETPQNPILQRGTNRAQVMQDRKGAFDTWRRTHNISILHAENFPYDESDFPDNLHLRRSRSGEFTARVTEAFIEMKRRQHAPLTAPQAAAPQVEGAPVPEGR